MLRARHIPLGALVALAACNGRIGDHPSSAGTGTGAAAGPGVGGAGGADPGGPVSACTSALSVGTTPLRRLSRSEYANTVRDLFGPQAPAPDLPTDPRSLGFDNNAAVLVVTPTVAERYLTVAEGLAAAATTTGTIGALAPCLATATSASESTCVQSFIHDFGARVFRRPLAAAEETALGKLFADARGDGDTLAQAVAVTLTGMLQSTAFLYRAELSQPAAGQTVAALSPFELASRLSYLLWGSMPDDTLMAAAASDQLASTDALAAQARRMLDDPRARAQAANFDGQWLDTAKIASIQKDAASYPDFTPAIATAMKTETDMFVDEVVWNGGGSLMGLFTAPYTFRNKALSGFYGAAGGPTGTSFARVELDPARAAGLLTQGGMMAAIAHAADTDPTRRGKFVRVQLLCETIPPPPPDVMAVPSAPDAGQTTRQHAVSQRGSGTCGGCHQFMDRIGFALENFDPTGRWRDSQNGQAIDASGEIVGTDVAGTLNGPAELGRKLASSAQVRRCVVKQWWRFASGRAEETADACALEGLDQAFVASGDRLRDLMLATIQDDGFRYRTVQP